MSVGNSEHFLLCCSSELIVCCDSSVSVECGKHHFTGVSKLLCKRNLAPESRGGVPGSQDPATLLLWVHLDAAPGGWSLTALPTLLPAVSPPVLQLRCWWEHPLSYFGPPEQQQLQEPEPSCSPSPAQASLATTLGGATEQVPLASGGGLTLGRAGLGSAGRGKAVGHLAYMIFWLREQTRRPGFVSAL